jgi:hypothetical protein
MQYCNNSELVILIPLSLLQWIGYRAQFMKLTPLSVRATRQKVKLNGEILMKKTAACFRMPPFFEEIIY